MGYTHYWNVNVNSGTFPPEFVIGVKQIVGQAKCPIVHEYDEPDTQPEISQEGIVFNGLEDDGHETFCLLPDGKWTFCKTARKPYDTVVTAVLILANHYGLITCSSDGNYDEWMPGLSLAKMATGISDLEIPEFG